MGGGGGSVSAWRNIYLRDDLLARFTERSRTTVVDAFASNIRLFVSGDVACRTNGKVKYVVPMGASLTKAASLRCALHDLLGVLTSFVGYTRRLSSGFLPWLKFAMALLRSTNVVTTLSLVAAEWFNCVSLEVFALFLDLGHILLMFQFPGSAPLLVALIERRRHSLWTSVPARPHLIVLHVVLPSEHGVLDSIARHSH